MANKLLITPLDGTPKQIVFADHGTDFDTGGNSPTAANDLRITSDGSFETNVQLDLTDLADAAARQSAKFDLGAHWARSYALRAAIEISNAPTAGAVIELYFGWTPNSTAANGNPGALTGSDAAYTGYNSNLAATVLQLDGPYVFVCTADYTGTVQVAEIGIIKPRGRYGILVVKNESGDALHSDAVESNIVLDPIVDESQ